MAKQGLIAAAGVLILSGCSDITRQTGSFERMASQREQASTAERRFLRDNPGPAIEMIRVPHSSFRPIAVRPGVSSDLLGRRVDLLFPGEPKFTDLLQTLSAIGIQVSFDSAQGNGEDLSRRRLPFARFSGSFGDLLQALRRSMGVVASQEGGMVILADKERYALQLPQSAEILEAVSKELEKLGASNVVTSVAAGKILFAAPPRLNDEILTPFLAKAQQNLAVVKMQTAIVQLQVKDEMRQGFDWRRFAANLDSTQSAINSANTPRFTGQNTGTGTGTGTGTTTNPLIANQTFQDPARNATAIREAGTVAGITDGVLRLGTTNVGTLFGVATAMSISGAIEALSTFGQTKIDQNVDLVTLATHEAKLESGQRIPYVRSIGLGALGTGTVGAGTLGAGSGAFGTANTDFVQTGIKLTMTPQFDADTSIVTVAVDLELKALIEFVQLNAGTQLGTLTQPRTQEQKLTDIVRVQAGRTIVIGGLQYDEWATDGNDPTWARPGMTPDSRTIGLRTRKLDRTALFIILRPTVTRYVTEGGQVRNAVSNARRGVVVAPK